VLFSKKYPQNERYFNLKSKLCSKNTNITLDRNARRV
jgi:hypothetical protein